LPACAAACADRRSRRPGSRRYAHGARRGTSSCLTPGMHRLIARVSPSATGLIRTDHAAVLELFHRYDPGAAASTRRALVARICLALEVHAQLEEEIFYPAMRSVDLALVGRLVPEHDRMRAAIGELRAADAGDPRFENSLYE